MKKWIFIGCGSVLLILVGGVGFIAWTFYGPVKDMYTQWEVEHPRFEALTTSYPFDPAAQEALDRARFGEHLDLRVALVDEFMAMQMDVARTVDDESLGFIERMRAPFVQFTSLPSMLAAEFEFKKMSPAEFAWYSRVLWASLRSLDKGVGGEALAPLRDRYSTLRQRYDEAAKDDNELPPLDEIIGTEDDFPPGSIELAQGVLALDVDRALRAVEVLAAEPMAMQAADADGFDSMVFPGQDGQMRLDLR
jgi:hypothetical protein